MGVRAGREMWSRLQNRVIRTPMQLARLRTADAQSHAHDRLKRTVSLCGVEVLLVDHADLLANLAQPPWVLLLGDHLHMVAGLCR